MKTKPSFVLIILLLSAAFNVQAFVTVGAGQNCDHSTLFAAYQDNDSNIRVANDQLYTDLFVISKPVVFQGGYDSCEDAEAGLIGDTNTQWSGIQNGTVILINAQQASPSLVTINHFNVINGQGPAGGIRVAGNSTLLLSQSTVVNNAGNNGGGVYVTGANAKAILFDSVVANNDATNGAGLYCENQATVDVIGDSVVTGNHAINGHGGGIYGTSGCTINVRSGADPELPLAQQLGIVDNTAITGGGVYLADGAHMLLQGDHLRPANIVGNTATSPTSGGGGVLLTGSETRFTAINGRIDDNQAALAGAGFLATNQSQFIMRRDNTPCWDNNRCSSLSGNFISNPNGISAAGYALFGATANIAQTTISGNRADDRSLFSVQLAGYLRLEGNLIYDNKNFNATVPDSLIYLGGQAGNGGNLDFFYNTLTNNINLAAIRLGFEAQHSVNIFNSIIFNLGTVFEQENTENNLIQADCSVMQESQSVTGNVGFISTSNPQFIDAPNDDFRLNANSIALDMCDESLFSGALYHDINGLARGHDLPDLADNFGPFDAGAHEQYSDLIFQSDFD